MHDAPNIHVLGGGAVGLTLAAYLAEAGRRVVVVRTSRDDVPAGRIPVTIRTAGAVLAISVETISLAQISQLDGIVVVTAKSHANEAIAAALSTKPAGGPLVIMQNGLDVEKPFLASRFPQIYRCVLYITGQMTSEHEVMFRPIASSPIGLVQGIGTDLEACVRSLSTAGFPFHAEADIQRDIWKKVIMNAVFNSVCPLLEADNGVFVRDEAVAQIAREIVGECSRLAERAGVPLTESELMKQVMQISQGSGGVLISTLQDLKNGRETEIESLNLAMGRMAAAANPPIDLSKTEFLGRMVLAKSVHSRLADK